jgi:tetratricopeptide (TPR) repeat protein
LLWTAENNGFFARPPVTRSDTTAPVRPPNFARTLEQLRAAEAVADPFERCANYPDPPWIRWDHELVVAFCKSRSFSHVGLDDIDTALSANRAESIDATFATYLADNFADPANRGILARVYREVFNVDSAEARDVVTRWVAARPMSAFALAARGAYYQVAAGSARGGDYARDTPAENFRRMRELDAKAEADLRKAVQIEPRLTAAYDSMIFVGRNSGNAALVDEALHAALAIDPDDERYYLDWMATCEPRWGGSLDSMARVADEAERHVNANPLMKLVREKQRAYLGIIEKNSDNYQAALAAFEQALALAPSSVDLGEAAEVAGKIGLYEKAIWYYSEALRFNRFADASDLTARAWLLRQIGRSDLAAADLRTVASLTSPGEDDLYQQAWAAFSMHDYASAERTYRKLLKLNPRNQGALLDLSKLYVGLKRVRDAEPLVAKLKQVYPTIPMTWYRAASVSEANGDHANEVAALKRYLDLVDSKDPDEQPQIDYAHIRLGQLGAVNK